MARRSIVIVSMCVVACTAVRDEDETGSPTAGSTAAQTTQSDSADASDDDSGGNDSSSDGGDGGHVTSFETLTTHATTDEPDDPTNTSSDTNDTGSTQVDILPENLIDDLEDGDAVIYELGGRIGLWYAYDDASGGSCNPAAMADFHTTPGGPNGSTHSAILVGDGYTNWGAGMGFDIDNSGGLIKHTFDASTFTGIAFQARGSGTIKFKVQTEAVVPVAEGGTCNAGTSCNDAYFTSIALTSSWAQHVIPFDTLAQGHWGQAAAWDAATIVGLQWEAGPGMPFEIAIDDVGLYE